jgi:hypothetical protein
MLFLKICQGWEIALVHPKQAMPLISCVCPFKIEYITYMLIHFRDIFMMLKDEGGWMVV